jgi:hypothetical protein
MQFLSKQCGPLGRAQPQELRASAIKHAKLKYSGFLETCPRVKGTRFPQSAVCLAKQLHFFLRDYKETIIVL